MRCEFYTITYLSEQGFRLNRLLRKENLVKTQIVNCVKLKQRYHTILLDYIIMRKFNDFYFVLFFIQPEIVKITTVRESGKLYLQLGTHE